MKPNRSIINGRTTRLATARYRQKSDVPLCALVSSSTSAPAEIKTILLVSQDAALHEDLRRLANALGRIVVRVSMPAGTIPVLQAVMPCAVLLDLDLPAEASWRTGELLLSQPNCPPLILLTARNNQFDLRTAIRAGSLLDKSGGPLRLLEAVEEVLAMPWQAQAERNGIQRVLIRWLKPGGWPVPPERAYGRWSMGR